MQRLLIALKRIMEPPKPKRRMLMQRSIPVNITKSQNYPKESQKKQENFKPSEEN